MRKLAQWPARGLELEMVKMLKNKTKKVQKPNVFGRFFSRTTSRRCEIARKWQKTNVSGHDAGYVSRSVRRIMAFAAIAAFLGGTCHVKAEHPSITAMPPVESAQLHHIWADDWTLWYDEKSMPPAMQFGVTGQPATVHFARQRFNNIDRTTNANSEFPWRHGGGLAAADHEVVKVVKFFWHPSHQPVRYYPRPRPVGDHRQQALDWTFPVGSVIGEVIAMKKPAGTYPIEVRLLTRDEDDWQPTIFRQFNSARDVADRLDQIGYRQLATKIGKLPIQRWKLTDDTHDRPAVTLAYSESQLPPIPANIVTQLLDAPLVEVVDPSTLADSHSQLLPAGYHPAQVGIDVDDCRQCHRHVAMHVDNFDRPGRDWYGYVRGSDRIFTFHPFANASISTNGGQLRVRTSQKLTDSGHIAKYDRESGYVFLGER